jgi:hypothetical protein
MSCSSAPLHIVSCIYSWIFNSSRSNINASIFVSQCMSWGTDLIFPDNGLWVPKCIHAPLVDDVIAVVWGLLSIVVGSWVDGVLDEGFFHIFGAPCLQSHWEAPTKVNTAVPSKWRYAGLVNISYMASSEDMSSKTRWKLSTGHELSWH